MGEFKKIIRKYIEEEKNREKREPRKQETSREGI